MLFRKIKVDAGGNGTHVGWAMILRTPEDVQKYIDIDTGYMAQALFNMEKSISKSHLSGAREIVLNYSLQAAASRLKPGEKKTAVDVIGDLQTGKLHNMLRMVLEGDEVKVNENGGYCNWSSFVRTWKDMEVLDEIQKDSTYFPTDKDALNVDVIILENAERAVDMEHEMGRLYDWNKGFRQRTIALLKEKDPAWVAECIKNAKVIAMETQAVDSKQVDSFMKLFTTMPRKTIYIRTSQEKDITSHPMFLKNSEIHDIKFI